MPLKWIPRSKSGASKSRPLWAAHTCIGNVWEYPPPRGLDEHPFEIRLGRRTTKGSSSGSRMRLVPVVILETHNPDKLQFLLKFV